MFEIYCDGSSKGNPGKGGWATVIYKDGHYITHRAEYQDEVTNNRMELTASSSFVICLLIACFKAETSL